MGSAFLRRVKGCHFGGIEWVESEINDTELSRRPLQSVTIKCL